ncbi:ATP-binding cassette domain-containing protein [Candidatus Korarchaeum cryptofilum]|jgi:ABC-2 type transport system ATP-binding protein|uniref:ATP-binding cassette domain-containing protein n=1 Tax=Candidatus Korarchaeum cryptofilum TaxID=498846 RepID=A0A429G1P6_9CREN|nr:ATP-binding cassette domain-containing protein [Candidatus Korarchaeum cryptofilum]RSN67751.1 ATP-binding cassette domain-containing protein [Candidatus Korarchaeum cryptofilum]
MKAISVRDLVKKFGDLRAVDGISFDVRKGEIFGFLGPNGAGKTTTINILVTLMRPTSGEAYVAGYNVVEEPVKVRERIGIVFQDPSVDRNLTGWENLYIHGLIYGLRGEELKRRIEESLEFAELTKFKDVEVKNYSGGMIRRLEIARGLMHEPEILFLDEPTIGLDPQTRAKIWEYVERLRNEAGVTVFLTTHYIEEAERLCDRVAIIDHGRIVAIGSPDELKQGIGGDVIYVRARDKSSLMKLVEELQENGMVLRYRELDGVLALSVNNASRVIPSVFEVANRMGIRIEEIKYTQPSLSDVFLHYTGREIRDEEADWRESVRMRHRVR